MELLGKLLDAFLQEPIRMYVPEIAVHCWISGADHSYWFLKKWVQQLTLELHDSGSGSGSDSVSDSGSASGLGSGSGYASSSAIRPAYLCPLSMRP